MTTIKAALSLSFKGVTMYIIIKIVKILLYLPFLSLNGEGCHSGTLDRIASTACEQNTIYLLWLFDYYVLKTGKSLCVFSCD